MSDPDEQVRRLLESARAEGPVPPQVAARLDDVLVGLVAEHEERHEVPSLDARRRRRGVSWAVAAAAAVVVGGVALGQVFQTGSGDSLSADDSAGAVSEESAAGTGDRDLLSQGDARSETPGQPAPTEAPAATLMEATFESDVLAVRALGISTSMTGLRRPGCEPPARGPRDEVFEVLYEGEPGSLVLRPARPGGQRALVYLCGDHRPARSVVVPAP